MKAKRFRDIVVEHSGLNKKEKWHFATAAFSVSNYLLAHDCYRIAMFACNLDCCSITEVHT